MYSGQMYPRHYFRPDESRFKHSDERRRYIERLKEQTAPLKLPTAPEGEPPLKEPPLKEPPLKESPFKFLKGKIKIKGINDIVGSISLEDAVLVGVIVFLVTDYCNNDIVMIGILLYLLFLC